MASVPKKVYIGAPTTTATSVYSVNVGKKLIVKNIVFTNVSSLDSTITVTLGGRDIVKDYTVTTKDTVTLDLAIVLEQGDAISVRQGTADAVNLFISGLEV